VPPIAIDPEQAGDIRAGVARSRGGFVARLRGLLTGGVDDEVWDEVEETLIAGDVGAAIAGRVVGRARAMHGAGDPMATVRSELAALLVPREPDWSPRPSGAGEPAVVLVVGVNGTGKTTTIGKLAFRLREHGHSVVVAAADTFRAAAEEQLGIWAERAGAEFVEGERGGDPAAVAYDAIERARRDGRDVVVVDTAGRLHTQTNLMEELAKVRRVITSRAEGAPHETLLVVDATTGQNAVQQARLFKEAVGVTGVALTKLDGSAKGGVAIPIVYELGLPVKLIGVGEALEDLRPFDAQDFARALVSG
jgi:fused signal recognition particle receptor